MALWRRSWLTVSVLLSLMAFSAASAQAQDAAKLWADFNHYVRIARPDLASAAAVALLTHTSDDQLLDAIEKSEYADYDDTFARATRMEALKDTAQQLVDHIHAAEVSRSRDPARILANIQKLGQGRRANFNATNQLKAAGQYAAPHLLAALIDDRQKELHPWVIAALMAIGQPMVYPLSEALPHLEPVPMSQVAQVLAEIGYPRALPYLKKVMENPQVDPGAVRTVTAAYYRLAQTSAAPQNASAAELFLMLGRNHYKTASNFTSAPGYDPATDTGVVWEYSREAGLIAIPVPGSAFGDVLAMRAAEQALAQDPRLDAALSLWLMANLRRENNLPAGVEDKSYQPPLRSPAFYLELAGPARQCEVLDQALNDGDAELALDAIRSLGTTVGNSSLPGQPRVLESLLQALDFPDPRVRIAAATAVARAQAASNAPTSPRVVATLAEALRPTDVKFALALASSQQYLDLLTDTLSAMGYRVVGALSIAELADQIPTTPAVDLIVAEHTIDQVEYLEHLTAVGGRFASAPFVALVSPADQAQLASRMGTIARLHPAPKPTDPAELQQAIDQALQKHQARSASPEQADQTAAEALQLLQLLASCTAGASDLSEALPALIQGLEDPRELFPENAAVVLAAIGLPQAQQAIANAALDDTRLTNARVALLHSLADSASRFGNHLTPSQISQLVDLVKNTQGELAEAGARAHGALSLPTTNIVQLIAR
jgi:DNA-binding response OmpR family regulator